MYSFAFTIKVLKELTLGFSFAITNHLGDVLFRSFAWKFTFYKTIKVN